MSPWLTVALAGAATYAIRVSLLVFVSHDVLPQIVRDSLRFVTAAVLAAVIAPAVLRAGDGDGIAWTLANERLAAALVAVAVAWLSRNIWATIAAGMGALWLLQSAT
jgi:branched-subunit amino acid transport protein